jgi:hypothetical protein
LEKPAKYPAVKIKFVPKTQNFLDVFLFGYKIIKKKKGNGRKNCNSKYFV